MVSGRSLPPDVGAAVGTELAFDFFGMLVVARARADQDAAPLQSGLIRCGSLFRDARTDERADQAARRAASARAGQRGRERTRDDQTKTRDNDRRADREDGSQSRP